MHLHGSAYTKNTTMFMEYRPTKQHLLMLEALLLPCSFDVTISFTSLGREISACYPKQIFQLLFVRFTCSSVNLWFYSESYINLCL